MRAKGVYVHFCLLTIVCACLALTACTYTISAYPPDAERQFGALPARISVLIPGDPDSEKAIKSGFFLLGMAHTWEFETGKALENYSEDYFSTLFDSVTTYHDVFTMNEDRKAHFQVFPQINRFDVTQGLSSSISLDCTIRTAKGDLVYQGRVTGETTSGGGAVNGCLGGPFVGESVLQKSFSEALEDAFQRLINDIRKPHSWNRLQGFLSEKEKSP